MHGLDKMVIAQAQHHKQKSVNKDLYGRSKSTFSKNKGIDGVPRNLPIDCYSKSWRAGLCKFEQDTVSEVAAFSVINLAKGIDRLVTLAPPAGTSGSGASADVGSSAQAGPSGQRSMNVD
jgi:hypothetical protein